MPSEEYLVEWIHRLVAVTTELLVIATMIASLINKNADLKIKVTSSRTTGLIITQIALGAMVIDLKLYAVLVAIHLGIGTCCFRWCY